LLVAPPRASFKQQQQPPPLHKSRLFPGRQQLQSALFCTPILELVEIDGNAAKRIPFPPSGFPRLHISITSHILAIYVPVSATTTRPASHGAQTTTHHHNGVDGLTG